MTLSNKHFFYLMTSTIVLFVVLSGGGAIFANRILAKQTNKLNQLKLESEIVDRQKQDTVVANANIERYQELEQIARQIVPQDKDQSRAVREIVGLAEESGITLSSISFPSSNLGQKTTTDKKEKAETAAPSQVKPVKDIKGVYELEIIVRGPKETDFPRLIEFLKRLESNRRTSQVSNLAITPDTKNPILLTFTMTIKVYLKP